MVSYLVPVQYMHLSLTIWPQRAIYCCSLCPKTDDLEIWGSRSSKVKCKDGFELAAYGFLFTPHTNNGVICYCFWDIQHFHLHGKPYSDPQFWGFLERKAPKMLRWKILTPKSIIYPRIRVFWAILRLSSPPRLVWARVEEKKEKKSHQPYISPPRRSAAAAPILTKLGRGGEGPIVISPYHFQVYCVKAVGLAGGGR